MKTKITHKTVLAFGAALGALWAGCLDLNLLDDMNPIDAGEEEFSADNTTGVGGGDDKNGASSIPVADPDDTAPPLVQSIECGAGERTDQGLCIAEGPISASFRFASSEPAAVSIEDASGVVSKVLSSPWDTLHHGAATNISDSEDTSLTLLLVDINDNQTAVTVSVRGKGGPAVAVTEVLADPVGAEPAQEFVEVVNIGDDTMDLSGWMVDDNGDKNGDLIPDGTVLGAGQVALLVSSTYNANSGTDPSPAENTVIIFLETSIGSNGLKNGEAETVELYDAAGVLVSAYNGSVGTPKEGISAARLSAELPDGDAAAFATDPSGSVSPGTAPRLK